MNHASQAAALPPPAQLRATVGQLLIQAVSEKSFDHFKIILALKEPMLHCARLPFSPYSSVVLQDSPWYGSKIVLS
jgi:hypothetical protein